MVYEFRRGTNVTQTARTNERTARYWCARFRSRNFDLKNEPRGRTDTLVNNNELKAIAEADDTQSTAELAAAFDVSIKTVLVNLPQIGKVVSMEDFHAELLKPRHLNFLYLDMNHIMYLLKKFIAEKHAWYNLFIKKTTSSRKILIIK